KSYATDWRMLLFNLAILMIVPIIIKYFLPFFRRFNFETAYQYLEVRFNRGIRWMASALFVFFMVSRIAIVLFLPSLALNAVTGFSVYFSIIIMGVVTIIYCTSGGMEAVIWGDVIQGFILIAGALVAFAYMVMGVDGGIGTFWDTAITHNKFDWLDFRFDFTQPVFWVVLIGGVANTLITYTSDQSVVQRYMTTKDEKATAKSIWLNGIISVPVSIIFFLLGTGLYVFYISNPANMSITNPNVDSVFPQFIVSEMPVGFAGLLIAAIFAAAMSTLSSNINSVAAVITSDFYKTLWTKITLKRSMSVARWAGIIVGLLGISMALILATWNIASLWDQFNTFLGLLTSGLGALFFLGIFFPRVGATSAFIGLIVGIIILVTVQSNTNVSFLLYGFIGMLSSIIVAYVASFVFPNKKDKKGYTWSSIKK
ncbi:MAG: sodium:solute symporter, partial [Dysgonamonadaceae bacterium]